MNVTVTVPPPSGGTTRQVSKSSLSHRTASSPVRAENPVTLRAKLSISYAPGVHAGSDNSTGEALSVRKLVSTRRLRWAAVSRSKVTTYRTSEIGAETAGVGAGACAAASPFVPHQASAAIAAIVRFMSCSSVVVVGPVATIGDP